MAHFPIIFALFRKTHDLLQRFFKWYITFLTKQWCKALKGGARISEKEGSKATTSLSFPNFHPWACNLSCWQSACD